MEVMYCVNEKAIFSMDNATFYPSKGEYVSYRGKNYRVDVVIYKINTSISSSRIVVHLEEI